MRFPVYSSDAFVAILADVYRLKSLPLSRDLGMPLLAPAGLKCRSAFMLPFGFYQTAEYLLGSEIERKWSEIKRYYDVSGVNVSLASIGRLPLDKERHVANNPVLDLSAYDPDLSFCSKNHRQNVRTARNKAVRHDVTISASSSLSDLQDFYGVLAKQYVKHHKMVFQPYSLYEKLFRSGVGELFVAKQDGRVVGGMFCIRDEDVYHYNWGARSPVFNLDIGTSLIDYAIGQAATRGFRFFDFGSTPLSDAELYGYKMKWGCDIHPVYKYYSMEVRQEVDLNQSYRLLRELYSKTPVWLAKRAMPALVPFLVQ